MTRPIAALALLVLSAVDARPAADNADANASLRQKAVHVLRTAMKSEARWIKVHAAEALLSGGEPQDVVAQTFVIELASKGGEPQYRIGIWRVLAQAAPSGERRDRWIAKILAAFQDVRGPDRLHA